MFPPGHSVPANVRPGSFVTARAGLDASVERPHLSSTREEDAVAKKSDRKGGKKGRKASARSDRELLELGEDLLTAVHLHHAVQDDEVRAALAAAHADLVQAAGDLVTRIARRFLQESGADTGARDRYERWTRDEAGESVEAAGSATGPEAQPGASH
jgi:hypothetical protein